MKALWLVWLGARAALATQAASQRGIFHRHKQHAAQVQARAHVQESAPSAPQESEQTVAAVAPEQTVAAVAPTEAPEDSTQMLPDISTLMGSTAETLKGIDSQASILEARIAQTQLANEAKMARAKAVFEQKLHAQDAKNRATKNENVEISSDIQELKSEIAGLQESGKKLREDNKENKEIKLAELQALAGALKEATSFVQQLVDVVDGEEADLLQTSDRVQLKKVALVEKKAVSHAVAPHDVAVAEDEDADEQDADRDKADTEDSEEVDEDSDADDKDEDEDDQAPSFLAVKAEVKREAVDATEALEANSQLADAEAQLAAAPTVSDDLPAAAASDPSDLMTLLSSGLGSLIKQEKSGETQLKAMFLKNFKSGTKKHSGLIKEQRALNATRTELATQVSELQKATAKLNVNERLKKLGHYMQSMAHLSLAPNGEVSEQLKALPVAGSLQSFEVTAVAK